MAPARAPGAPGAPGAPAAFTDLRTRSAYAEGAVLLDYKAVINAISTGLRRGVRAFPIHAFDRDYLALKADSYQWFADKYIDHVLSRMVYRGQSGVFEDCDDFARVAVGQMILGAIAERMPHQPAFGEIRYDTQRGGHHMANIAVDSKRKVWLYEPQNRKWTDDLKAIAEVIEVRL